MNNRHTFNFDGGDYLTTMGAAWFTSFCYFNHIDSEHKNWKKVSTWSNRKSIYNSTEEYHIYWLQKVLEMVDSNLNKNKIGLNGYQVKKMAAELLNKLNIQI